MLLGLALHAITTSTVAAKPPHIWFILVDDLGFADVGFNRATPDREVVSPALNDIVKHGVLLERHYVHKMCTPTRTSVQSGRLPVHVSTSLANPEDPSCGVAQNMTGMATMLKRAGYTSHFVGKWDAGMATPRHTPQGRGYTTSLNYFEHKNDFYTEKSMQTTCTGTTDLWDTDQPAFNLTNTGYEEYLFRDRMHKVSGGSLVAPSYS
jgi:arylsulfatase I/J